MKIKPCGDQALMVDVGELRDVLLLRTIVESWELEGIIDLVPASTTLLIMMDTALLSPKDLATRLSATSLTDAHTDSTSTSAEIRIPVVYDGPDLSSLADHFGWSAEELVKRHTEAVWTAAFGGFAPGFMYLVTDSPFPTVPRLDAPRAAIPAGSVGLAGAFSGIYPQPSPGGWQLIGSTTEQMWDPARTDRPAFITPGDRVRFVEVK